MLCFSTLLATPAMLPTPICVPPAPGAAADPGIGLGRVSKLRIMSAAWLPPAMLGSAPGGPNGTGFGCWGWPSGVAPGCWAPGLNGFPGTPGNAGTGDCGTPGTEANPVPG